MDDRDKVIAYLRTLSSEALVALLREAKVCAPWVLDDEERGAGPYYYLACVGGKHLATVYCAEDGVTYGEPDLAGQRAAEDAAIAAGYRVPWRQS